MTPLTLLLALTLLPPAGRAHVSYTISGQDARCVTDTHRGVKLDLLGYGASSGASNASDVLFSKHAGLEDCLLSCCSDAACDGFLHLSSQATINCYGVRCHALHASPNDSSHDSRGDATCHVLRSGGTDPTFVTVGNSEREMPRITFDDKTTPPPPPPSTRPPPPSDDVMISSQPLQPPSGGPGLLAPPPEEPTVEEREGHLLALVLLLLGIGIAVVMVVLLGRTLYDDYQHREYNALG